MSKYNVYVEDVSVEAVFNKLGGVEGAKCFLRDEMEIVMKKAKEVKEAVVSLLILIKTITAPVAAGKKTADCFTNKTRYYYRDSDLDSWLPENQPEQPKSEFSVQKLAQNATFKHAVENFLGVAGEIPVLAKTLRERGCTTTLPVIESLIERQEAGEDVGLRTDGWANFFFVEEKKEDGQEEPSVSVVSAVRGGRQWYVSIHRLGLDRVWAADRRFFFRN